MSAASLEFIWIALTCQLCEALPGLPRVLCLLSLGSCLVPRARRRSSSTLAAHGRRRIYYPTSPPAPAAIRNCDGGFVDGVERVATLVLLLVRVGQGAYSLCLSGDCAIRAVPLSLAANGLVYIVAASVACTALANARPFRRGGKSGQRRKAPPSACHYRRQCSSAPPHSDH